jgi:predicted GIY-YIG superfamily endonuclease
VAAQAGFRRGLHQAGVHDLVWYEQHEDMLAAITREKTLKEWKRAWNRVDREDESGMEGFV